MTAEVIAAYIIIVFSVVGFAIWCGRYAQRVDNVEKDSDELKEGCATTKTALLETLEKQSQDFNDTLKTHVEAELLRDSKVDVLRESLQEYVRDQIKHSERLRQNKEQTEELKKDFNVMQVEIESIKETTGGIKTDVAKLFLMMEQLVEVGKETQITVKEILKENRKDKS